ncbi:MAG: PAS domain S-box protein [Desulfobacteraceae bacterium]|nr:PAS domain S-box protein [Desulfobacteraceae bacterium]
MDSSVQLSDERYKAFIEDISDGVYETDNYGNFTYLNNSICKIFGYPREEIQWQNYSKFMDKKRGRMAYDVFNKIWVTQKGFSDLIWEIIDKDGKTRVIELSANLIINKEGKKTGFRGIARDVTENFRMLETIRESEARYQREYEASRRAERQVRLLLDFVPNPMVVFTLDGKVFFLNRAFSEVFGWTLDELRGRRIPYVPPDLQQDAEESVKRLLEEKVIIRHETRRLTKNGRILDVILKGVIYSEDEDEAGGELVLLRDITEEKRAARVNQALFRISMALPEYPDLEDLLDYISSEMKRLMNVEVAHVMLLDEERREIFFKGAAYDDSATQERVKEIRIPFDKSVVGKVIKTGEPIIVPDTSKEPDFYPGVDKRLEYHTKNLLNVPLRSSDRIIGVLSARNKKEGAFEQTDIELLNMLAGTVALSIENARFSEEIKEAYREVTSLNRAKDKVINHLSHELKTPVSVLSASLDILAKKMAPLPEETWSQTMERAKRNLDRLLEIQYEVEDIMRDEDFASYHLLSLLLDQCSDELESLVAEETGEGPIIQKIRNRIEEIFGPKESEIRAIHLHGFVQERLGVLRPQFSHRQVEIVTHLESVPSICIPPDVLEKILDGLIKNAIENTPDEGRIDLTVRRKGTGVELEVHDYGVGITEEDQKRIFEGFFTTQETIAYSSKQPFDFNAGGKGADLLRMKIFSERYNFKIDMHSSRCRFITKESDICPGRISNCSFCTREEDCHHSGGTTFTLYFPPAPGQD